MVEREDIWLLFAIGNIIMSPPPGINNGWYLPPGKANDFKETCGIVSVNYHFLSEGLVENPTGG